jgi:hypothetical protein
VAKITHAYHNPLGGDEPRPDAVVLFELHGLNIDLYKKKELIHSLHVMVHHPEIKNYEVVPVYKVVTTEKHKDKNIFTGLIKFNEKIKNLKDISFSDQLFLYLSYYTSIHVIKD